MNSKKDKKKQLKPRGTPSHFVLEVGGGKPPFEMMPTELVLPQTKEEIEREVACGFAQHLRALDMQLKIVGDPLQNPEADIDFTIETGSGMAGMELVEFAPITPDEKYGSKPRPFSPLERGKQVAHQIHKKNNKYQKYTRLRRKVLLIYVTDNLWALDQYTIMVVKALCIKEKPIFDYVYYYKPMKDIAGPIEQIHPIGADELRELMESKVPSECLTIL